jgi:hypothetical protein
VFAALKRRNILQDVQTLVLDGLSVTSELVSEIILDDSFNVRLLSIREVQNLNERKLMQALEYSVRPTRPAGMPRLKGLYFFGKKEVSLSAVSPNTGNSNRITENAPNSQASGGVAVVHGAQIGAQLNQRSRAALSNSLRQTEADTDAVFPVVRKSPMRGWAETILACSGLISFDATLCTGPRHIFNTEIPADQKRWYEEYEAHLPASLARAALQGCCICQAAPEWAFNRDHVPMKTIPLQGRPPLHSSLPKVATKPEKGQARAKPCLVARCNDCLRGRYCESCRKWWCEDCYRTVVDQTPMHPPLSGERSIAANSKVYMGLCVENCLVEEMISGALSRGI